MPYDFQRDFITPLTRDLTEGNLGGAEDFANAVTKYYMDTVKKGLPQGVPTTLPAPGLNPTSPPPFVIGAKGVVPNQAKQRIFYETVKAYFLAKELSLDKGSIKGLKDSLQQTLNKLKTKKAEIQDLIKNTKELAKEIANLPIHIQEVIEGAKEVIQEEKDKIADVSRLFTELEAELKQQGIGSDQFKSIFSQELQLVDQVSNFKITSFQDFTSIPDKIASIKGTVNTIKSSAGIVTLNVDSPADLERVRASQRNYSATDESPQSELVGQFTGDALTDDLRRAEGARRDKINALKFYAANRLGEAALSIEQLSLIVIEPPRFITYIERVARKNPKANRLYRAIVKLDSIERFIKPQLKKLEVQIDIKKKEIKNYIEPRIESIKQKLEDRVTEYAQKKKLGAKLRLYAKAKQRVDQFKKDHEKKILLRKKQIQMTQKAIQKSTLLFERSIALQRSVVTEFESLKSELILLKEKAVSGEILANYAEASKDLKDGLAKVKSTQLTDIEAVRELTPDNPLQEPSLRTTNPELFVQGYERQIDSVADLERTRELRRNSIDNQQSDIATPEQVYEYMNQLGLGDFATPVVNILASAKTDLASFKRLFERRTDYYKTFMASIQDLVAEAKELQSLLQDLWESRDSNGKPAAWTKEQSKSLGEKVKYSKVGKYVVKVKVSLQDLLNELVKRVDPLVKKLKVWASRLYKRAKDYIEEKTKKLQDDIEAYLINLIPLKGYQKKKLEDAENRKLIIEAKKQRIEEFKKTIEYYQKLGLAIGKMARGSQGLSVNMFDAKVYSYAQNQNHIKNIADGLYGFKILEAGGDKARVASLKQEKEEFMNRMKTIGVIDALVNGLIILFKEITKTPAGKQFVQELKRFGETLNNTGSQFAATWSEFVKVFDSLPTTAKALNAFVDEVLSSDVVIKMLESTEVVTFLIDVERRYLGRARELLKTLTDSSVQQAVGQVESDIQNQRGSSRSVTKKGFEVLVEWSDALNSRESFIKFMLIQLKKSLDKFLTFVRAEVQVFITKQKKKIQEKFEKKKQTYELELEKIKERAVNVDAKVMSIAMGLAARLFWTGATWQGDTGTNHITLNIGPFKPLKALPEDGVTGLVEELGKSFENQLVAMSGLVIPPANTGIVPIPFQGYK